MNLSELLLGQPKPVPDIERLMGQEKHEALLAKERLRKALEEKRQAELRMKQEAEQARLKAKEKRQGYVTRLRNRGHLDKMRIPDPPVTATQRERELAEMKRTLQDTDISQAEIENLYRLHQTFESLEASPLP